MKNAIVFIPASRDWMEANFMFEFLRNIPVSGWEISSSNLKGHCAADRHNQAFNMLPNLEKMWNKRFDRILFMDTDQYYPGNYYIKMLAHADPVVASYSASRYPPYDIGQYTCAKMKTVDGVEFPDYQPVGNNYDPHDESTFFCDAVGLGAAMFDRNLVDEIKSPWFTDLVDKSGTRLLCDDFYFFSLLNKAGYRVLVDKNIMVGHYSRELVLPSNRQHFEAAYNEGLKYTEQW